jgi:hypothetical protein
MSTEALNLGAANAEDVAAQNPPATGAESTGDVAKPSSTAFLHSPPYSNNATKSDASDSELSDLDDEAFLADAPPLPRPELAQAEPQPQPTDEQPASQPEQNQEPEEDIGEVLPAEWSGKVPIFRPTMHQFKDFTRFVSWPR